jgi:hypothetical protein
MLVIRPREFDGSIRSAERSQSMRISLYFQYLTLELFPNKIHVLRQENTCSPRSVHRRTRTASADSARVCNQDDPQLSVFVIVEK